MKNWIPAKCVSGWKWSWWFLCVSLGIEVGQLGWTCGERQRRLRWWPTVIHQLNSNTLTAHIEGFRPKSLNLYFPRLWLCFCNLDVTLFHIFLCESFQVLLINVFFSSEPQFEESLQCVCFSAVIHLLQICRASNALKRCTGVFIMFCGHSPIPNRWAESMFHFGYGMSQ